MNHNGEIIGVNVSTMGNDVSFLVPVDYLKKLYDLIQSETFTGADNWESVIEEQLLTNQDEFIGDLLAREWDHLTVGELLVPGNIAQPFKCWGKTDDKEKSLVLKARSQCSTEDYISLSDEIYTSNYQFWFAYHKSKGIGPFRLYSHLEEDFAGSHEMDFYDEENFTKFQCHTDFVKVAGKVWKSAFCSRNYKKFKQLYDIELVLSTVDDVHQNHMGMISAYGISQKRARDLVKKFMGEIK